VAAALCCYLRTRMLVVIEVIPSHNESRSGDADLKREECVAQNPYVSNALWGASMRTRWDAACSHAQAIYFTESHQVVSFDLRHGRFGRLRKLQTLMDSGIASICRSSWDTLVASILL
jgi:hypothetical protein